MKRFLWWFFWLQFGMPFLVASAFGTTVSIYEGDWRAPWSGFGVGFLGVVYLSPFLLVNTLVCGVAIAAARSRRAIRLILAMDAFAAFFLFGYAAFSRTPVFGIICFVTWASASAPLILYVPMGEPGSRRPLPWKSE